MTETTDSPLSFKSLENSPKGTSISLEQTFNAIPWNADGLIPVIAQDVNSKQVLMLAWANQKALSHSISSGKAHYWSRSRQALWCKGETTGHTQTIHGIHLDCDGDALLYLVDQAGAACHTHRSHCFFWEVSQSNASITSNPGTQDI